MQAQASKARPQIQVLPPGVAERIAAGEIIERPSSVVKELLENSLDAGATEVIVALKDGGKSLIEVTDNGHGMTPEELMLCVKRHATSKLKTLSDLEKIQTLGFRGEALPSVGAVAELSILSRTADSDTAYEFRLGTLADTGREESASPKAVTFGHFAQSTHGTRIQAQGLFAQVPARLKFLKSQGAEVGQVREWMERLALTHPATGFKLLSDDRTVLNLRPQSETDRVRAVLADGEDFPLVTGQEPGIDDGGLRIRIHWLQGLSTPQTRKLVQVVNGRAVRDRVLQQALLSPFRQALLPGQFPALALFIETDPATVDVNVHPAKAEVRFLESGRVFRTVQRLAESLIAQKGAPAYVSAFDSSAGTHPMASTWAPPKWTASESPIENRGWDFKTSPVSPSPAQNQEAPAAAAATSAAPVTPSQYVGALFNTYLIYDAGHEMILIDQHAAHERVRYEQLRKQLDHGKLSPQALLIPEAVHFDLEARENVDAAVSWLGSRGFEAEVFGEDTLLFRAVPGEWGTHSLRTRLKNLVGRLLIQPTSAGDAQTPLLDEALFESVASEACHSAIRAGDRLERAEAISLVDQLFLCAHPWNCPHGRPTVTRVPKARLEEWFQRRV